MHLSPDKHILGRQRDLLVALSDISKHGSHDLIFWQIDLRIEIWYAEFTAAAAAGGHLNNAKCRSRVGEHDRIAIDRMLYDDLTRYLFLTDRFRKQVERIGRFAASVNDTVDAELFVQVGLNDLPAA